MYNIVDRTHVGSLRLDLCYSSTQMTEKASLRGRSTVLLLLSAAVAATAAVALVSEDVGDRELTLTDSLHPFHQGSDS